MSTVVGLAGILDEVLMAHDALLRQVVCASGEGGMVITDGEGRRMRKHFYEAVAPAGLRASDGLSVIRSITSSDDGVCGDRTSERIVNIWERRGKVMPFRRPK